jgi:hypothetical protein
MSYRDNLSNPEWRELQAKLIEPDGDSAAVRMVNTILAAIRMFEIESHSAVAAELAGGGNDA